MLDIVRKAILGLKDTQDLILYSAMSDNTLFAFFSRSTVFLIVLPFMGILMLATAILNTIEFLQANNKNLDRWFRTGISILCALISSVSLYGGAIAKGLGFLFPIGPWFFFSSLSVGCFYQLATLGVALFRIFESQPNSVQRMHYIQAAFHHAFMVANMAVAMCSVLFVLLFPAVPYCGLIFSIATAAFIGINFLWRIAPTTWKQTIKSSLHLGKPEVVESITVIDNQRRVELVQDLVEENNNSLRFFTCPDYSAKVKQLDYETARQFLLGIIDAKITKLHSQDTSIKNQHKIDLLIYTVWSINSDLEINKIDLLEAYPMGFQSFFKEKGDVEQMVDAALVLQSKFNSQPENADSMVGMGMVH